MLKKSHIQTLRMKLLLILICCTSVAAWAPRLGMTAASRSSRTDRQAVKMLSEEERAKLISEVLIYDMQLEQQKIEVEQRASAAESQAKKDAELATISQAEAQRLAAEVEELKMSVAAASRHAKQQDEVIEGLQAEIKSTISELSSCQSDLHSSRESQSEQSKKLSALQGKFDACSADLDCAIKSLDSA